MKFRLLIWISGLALIILGLVQYFIITETFHTKQQQFDEKYSSLTKLGLFEYENQFADFSEDSIFNVMDDYAYFALYNIGFANEKDLDSIYHQVFYDFQNILDNLGKKEDFLKDYFQEAGEPGDFEVACILTEVVLLSFERETQISSEALGTRKKQDNPAILVNTYTVERNNFRMTYDYYISFRHRSEQLAREMIGAVSLSAITLLIVFFVFFLTLRNLLIQKRLSDLKTDFINNMTHELKTPLSTIAVASSSLLKGDEKLSKDRVLEISGIIKKQNNHLSRLIDKILDISIWEKDQVKISKKEVRLQEFLDDILRNFSVSNPAVELHIGFDGIDELKKVTLDEVHFTTVLNNLLSNAIKYGGSPPSVTFKSTLNEKLSISITDNGKGIHREEQKYIFDKFYRGKDAKKNAIKGLGLGLYYVKQIVEAHGGKIILEHSSANGSVLNLEIPV